MVQSQELGATNKTLRIGEVASRAGVSVDTVRFYERRGLIEMPERTPSGYRMYPLHAVDRILITRQLRELGMTLDEIASAMCAVEKVKSYSSELWRLELVRDRIDDKIAALQSTRERLASMIEACQGPTCPIQAPVR